MTESLRQSTRGVFDYPLSSARRHGPRGYVDYASYKPWLRDEFLFRCVYCLSRERWRPEGQDAFSVDHVRPQATHPDEADDYDNLVYACCSCNSSRRDLPLPLDPVRDALGGHLRIAATGIAEPYSGKQPGEAPAGRTSADLLIEPHSRMTDKEIVEHKTHPALQLPAHHLSASPPAAPAPEVQRHRAAIRRSEFPLATFEKQLSNVSSPLVGEGRVRGDTMNRELQRAARLLRKRLPTPRSHSLPERYQSRPPEYTTCRIFRWAACFFASRL